MKLNLACGKDRKEGFVNIDITPEVGPDRVMDLLDFPWKGIQENTIAEIFVGHFCEHIPHEIRGNPGKDGLTLFMEECYRVMLDTGILTIKFPFAFSIGAMSDPTHCRYLTSATFQYYDKLWRAANLGAYYPIGTDFEILELGLRAHEFESPPPVPEYMLVNRLYEVTAVMKCHKPVRK